MSENAQIDRPRRFPLVQNCLRSILLHETELAFRAAGLITAETQAQARDPDENARTE